MPEVDLAKRRRIMQRSRKLGHCTCDPRRPCPCDVFKNQGMCPCAGERPDPVPMEQVRLTELVHNAGCASKIAPADLEAVLARLPGVDDPAVLSGIPAGDDAGIYAIGDGMTLVQTVDVFTPCVDDPYLFGRVCAANCMSDVYAMGGVPRTALSIIGFPAETLDSQIMYHMMKGAMDVFAEARVALIGGHSIKDEEIKLGFAITGTIDAALTFGHDTARVGDVLVLTKPLGTGVLNFARQIGRPVGEGMAEAERSMAGLNRSAAEAMKEVGVSACTDVTGFGLFGHLISMVRHSGVTAQIYADALPAFEGAVEALAEGVVPGAIERNREYVGDDLRVGDGVAEALVHLGFDAQTSGGLLIAVPEKKHEALLDALAARGVMSVTVGRIVSESSGQIVVTNVGASAAAVADRTEETDEMAKHKPSGGEAHSAPCCADAAGAAPGSGASAEAKKAFVQLIRSTQAGGTIDARTKELIAYALVALQRCGPCITRHRERAFEMGITEAELDEAVWSATAIGGACVRVFYDEWLKNGKTGEAGACCP